jgi:D-beta-D-heptose 7-phosphate kinase/D-beta-D-heptose 1-phosphate adenosyltransferase
MMVPDFRGARALVIGDVMLDEHLRGVVRRISPEAPVPVLEFRSRTHGLGGAANVAQVVRSMGGTAAVVGVCGVDSSADVLRALLRDDGIDPFLIPDATRPTTLKTRILAGEQQICRVDDEARHEVSASIAEAVLRAFRAALATGTDAVIVSDYGKGALPSSVIAEALVDARAAGVPVVVDPSLGDPSRYAGATVMKPNQSELFAMAGMSLDDDLDRAADHVRSALGTTALLVTRGRDGMRLYDGDGVLDLPADVHLVSDVTGAGDTVAAVLALGMGTGLSLAAAARLANRAGGLAVTRPGTAPVTRADLVAAEEKHG